MAKLKKCPGYKDTKGTCANMITNKKKYWCDSCDAIRRKTIVAQFDKIYKTKRELKKFYQENDIIFTQEQIGGVV
jgi:hypothetical protein